MSDLAHPPQPKPTQAEADEFMADALGFGDGGDGAPYVAKAVHFDGNAWLANNALVATDNKFFSMVGWFKVGSASVNENIFIVDPEGNYSSYFYIYSSGSWGVTVANTSGTTSFSLGSLVSMSTPNGWHNFIVSMDVNGSAGTKKGQVYIDDVLVTASPSDAGPTFTIAFNGIPLWFGADDTTNDGILMDTADVRIMPGVSLLDGTGNIPVATRRLFIDAAGKPVDPAVATAALGAPCVLFSGDASSFATNQGTGGSFTHGGNALTNATTSPSD